ncbi:hypothetical protein [Arthrobacter sp. B10-11]|nr:hypothetical protein [Arthrobacter sp. B10-11]MDV8147191.1 hypothetical protein [Arthrobacter sp. B10-11]
MGPYLGAASAVARRYLDKDVEGLLGWMKENVNGVKPEPEP